jgi:ATP-dependent RNA helicase RhlE
MPAWKMQSTCSHISYCQVQSGETPLLIATDVAARGLDIDDVEVVINYSFPLVRHNCCTGITCAAGWTLLVAACCC